MDADELLLRERLHRAYDAAVPGAALVPSRVLNRVHARVELAAHRRRMVLGVAVGAAALAAFAAVGVQVVPRSVQLQPGDPRLAQGRGANSGPESDGAAAAGPANASAAAAPSHTSSPLQPCAAGALLVTVRTDHNSYLQGDVATVTTEATNRGHVACHYPLGPAVWVTNSHGQQWRLCPEMDTPPPSPGSASAMAPAMAISIPRSGLRPGESESQTCTWHTAYGNVPPGVYTAHATWNSTSEAAYLTIVAATATPTPTPTPTPAAPPPTPTPPPTQTPFLPLP